MKDETGREMMTYYWGGRDLLRGVGAIHAGNGTLRFSPHRIESTAVNRDTPPEFYRCSYCGGSSHDGFCPRIKAIDYYPLGGIKRVELYDE